MKRHRPPSMSRAFDTAFDMIKMNHLRASYGAALFDSILMKAMEDDVLRKNLEDYMNMSMEELIALPPEEKEHAFNLIQAARSGVDPSPPPNPANLMSTKDPQGEATMPKKPMAKALDAFFDAEFIRKNVIGMQGGTEYKMPPSIASMAQRQQVPEMQPRGLFGRMKPTGDMTVGQRPPSRLDSEGQPVYPVQNRLEEGAVQQNPPHPMGDMMGAGPAPGAEVTRMPRPGPYPGDTNLDTHYPPTRNPSIENIRRNSPVGNIHYRNLSNPTVGSPTYGESRGFDYFNASSPPQGSFGDQFAPRIRYN